MSRFDSISVFPLPFGERGLKAGFYTISFLYVGAVIVLLWPYDWENKLFPLVAAIPTFLFLGLQLVFLAFPSIEERLSTDQDGAMDFEDMLDRENSEEGLGRTRGARQKTELEMVVWISALLLAIFLFGMRPVFPVYVFGFSLYFTRNLRKSAVTTGIFSVSAYLLFDIVLGLQPIGGIF